MWKRYRTVILAWAALCVVYVLTRLVNLGIIPIFTDEAIYLRWSQIMAYDASLRYLPLVDGKPPLFMWAVSGVLRLLPVFDPVISGRLVSVAAGFGGMVGIYLLARQVFGDRKIAYLSAVLYLLVPFTFFYDRFGLADTMLAMWATWSLVLGIWLARSLRPDAALLLGWAVGFGLLTKTPALFFLLFQPLLLVFFDWQKERRPTRLLIWAGLLGVALFEAELIYGILRLFPLFHMVAQKNAEFVVSFGEFLRHPFSLFRDNALTLLRWQIGYLTVPVAFFTLFGAALAIVRKNITAFVLLAVYLCFFIAMASFNKSIFPRFLLTFTPPLLVLAAAGIVKFSHLPKIKFLSPPKLLLLITAGVLFIPLFTDFKLVTDPPGAPIPDGDSHQYINGWPAGYGVKEIRDFLTAQSQQYPEVLIGTEGTFGLMPYSLQLYQKDYPNVRIKDYWPLPEKVPAEIALAAKSQPTFFVVYQRPQPPISWKVKLLAKYQQGNSGDYLQLYQVLPGNDQ